MLESTDIMLLRNHFGMNRIAQVGALAALQDQAWLAHVQAEVAMARGVVAEIALENELKPLVSATNFVTIDCCRDAVFAKAVLSGLVSHGVFVRMPFAAPGNRCIRISAGTSEDLACLRTVLPEVLRDIG